MNLFSYVKNNPTRFTDSYGLQCLTEQGMSLAMLAALLGAAYLAWQEGLDQQGGNPFPSLEDLGYFPNFDPFNPMGRGPKIPKPDPLVKGGLFLGLLHQARKFLERFGGNSSSENNSNDNNSLPKLPEVQPISEYKTGDQISGM